MPPNAAIQRMQRLMGSTAFLTDGAGGSAQTYLIQACPPVFSEKPRASPHGPPLVQAHRASRIIRLFRSLAFRRRRLGR
eukprot:scaffold91782_cov96-Phaeocystis_antarctica.AAC.1